MLKYSIKQKGTFLTAMGEVGERWRNARGQWQRPPEVVRPPIQTNLMPWDKVSFSKWFDNNVQGKFKVGDLVTRIEVQPNTTHTPVYYFEVAYLNELYYTCAWNNLLNEPSCIHIRGRSGETLHRSPKELRQLTVEEVALVNLQNIEAQGFPQ